MSNTQNNQDIENKASLDKEDEAFVKFDEEQTENKDENTIDDEIKKIVGSADALIKVLEKIAPEVNSDKVVNPEAFLKIIKQVNMNYRHNGLNLFATYKFSDATWMQKATYEQTVIELLKRSPHWKPARLSDGEEVNMEFTLPVVFTPR